MTGASTVLTTIQPVDKNSIRDRRHPINNPLHRIPGNKNNDVFPVSRGPKRKTDLVFRSFSRVSIGVMYLMTRRYNELYKIRNGDADFVLHLF